MPRCRGFVTAGIICLLTACLLVGCNDNPTEPKPTGYWLYATATLASGNYDTWLYRFDADADTLVDSIVLGPDLQQIYVSPDGKYISALGGEQCTRIFDAQTLTEIGQLSCEVEPVFLPHKGIIVAFHSAGYTTYDYNSLATKSEES